MSRLKCLILLIAISIAGTLFAQDDLPPVPDPPRLVNDLTGNTLSGAQRDALERKLLNYEDTTSTQVAILIVSTTNPYEIADFAQRTGQKWGVGSSQDNGILVVVAVEDRLAHIATGYGMEGSIPDAAAYTIITNEMRPEFRQGDYYSGLDRATDVIFDLASGEYTADQLTGGEGQFNWGVVIFFLLIFVVFPMWASYRRRKYQDIGTRDVPWWIFMAGGGHGGSGWDDFSRGRGGFGGGGGSGGGFGGFGGGGFGGGGATGGW